MALIDPRTFADSVEQLDNLPPIERSFVLFASALPHLERIIAEACATRDATTLSELFAVVSIGDWTDHSQ
jgi:hypothetical protein